MANLWTNDVILKNYRDDHSINLFRRTFLNVNVLSWDQRHLYCYIYSGPFLERLYYEKLYMFSDRYFLLLFVGRKIQLQTNYRNSELKLCANLSNEKTLHWHKMAQRSSDLIIAYLVQLIEIFYSVSHWPFKGKNNRKQWGTS